MSVRDDEGFPRQHEGPRWTAYDALTAKSDPERRRILEVLQKQRSARAEELMKMSNAALHPRQPSFLDKRDRSTVVMR